MALSLDVEKLCNLTHRIFSKCDKIGISSIILKPEKMESESSNETSCHDRNTISIPMESLMQDLKSCGFFETGCKLYCSKVIEIPNDENTIQLPTHVKWLENSPIQDDLNLSGYFTAREPNKIVNSERSIFGTFMNIQTPVSDPKFSSFIPYDGRFASSCDGVRQINVHILPNEEIQNKPNIIQASIIDCATIGHLIGVVLNILECEFGILLANDIDNFEMYLVENGQPETCIPALTKSVAVKTCKFRDLALVKAKNQKKFEPPSSIIIFFRHQEFVLKLENTNEKLQSLVFRFAKKELNLDISNWECIQLYTISDSGEIDDPYVNLDGLARNYIGCKFKFDIDPSSINCGISIDPIKETSENFGNSTCKSQNTSGSSQNDEVYNVKILDRFVNYDASLNILGDGLIITTMEKSLFRFNKPKASIVILCGEIEQCKVVDNIQSKNKIILRIKYKKNAKTSTTLDLEVFQSDYAKITHSIDALM